jgi:hypothetical protein
MGYDDVFFGEEIQVKKYGFFQITEENGILNNV